MVSINGEEDAVHREGLIQFLAIPPFLLSFLFHLLSVSLFSIAKTKCPRLGDLSKLEVCLPHDWKLDVQEVSSVQHLVASFLLCHAMVTGIAYWHGACVIAQVSPSLSSKPPTLSWRPQFMASSNPIYFEKGSPSHDINTWFWGVSYCLDFVFLFPNLTTVRII